MISINLFPTNRIILTFFFMLAYINNCEAILYKCRDPLSGHVLYTSTYEQTNCQIIEEKKQIVESRNKPDPITPISEEKYMNDYLSFPKNLLNDEPYYE